MVTNQYGTQFSSPILEKMDKKMGLWSLHKEYMLIIKSIFLGRMLEPISRKQTLRHILLLFGNNSSEKLHRRAVGFSLESKILQKKLQVAKRAVVHCASGRRQCMRSHGWLASVQTCMCDHINGVCAQCTLGWWWNIFTKPAITTTTATLCQKKVFSWTTWVQKKNNAKSFLPINGDKLHRISREKTTRTAEKNTAYWNEGGKMSYNVNV